MNKGLLSGFLTILISLCAAGYTSAQQPAQTPTPDEFNSDTSKDDILILVNIKAKELKFDIVPNTTVEFPGTRHRSTIWVTQRQNLPEKVEPGVTYRDIGIQLRISSRFADIERIVKEALGEIPITDEPTTSSPPISSPPNPVPTRVIETPTAPTAPPVAPPRRPQRR
jgi:hypothetical protein